MELAMESAEGRSFAQIAASSADGALVGLLIHAVMRASLLAPRTLTFTNAQPTLWTQPSPGWIPADTKQEASSP